MIRDEHLQQAHPHLICRGRDSGVGWGGQPRFCIRSLSLTVEHCRMMRVNGSSSSSSSFYSSLQLMGWSRMLALQYAVASDLWRYRNWVRRNWLQRELLVRPPHPAVVCDWADTQTPLSSVMRDQAPTTTTLFRTGVGGAFRFSFELGTSSWGQRSKFESSILSLSFLDCPNCFRSKRKILIIDFWGRWNFKYF